MKRYISYIILSTLIISSCKDDMPTEPKIEGVSKIISATQGGEITTEDGIKLEIPPGALKEDTKITLTPFIGTKMHEWCAKAVHLEPDGLTLEKPAKLSFQLPSNWPIDHNPLIYVSFTSDASEYFDTGICADIIKSENKIFAHTEILHFSKYGAIANCHKGTLAFLLKNFKNRGCDENNAWQKVKDKFPDTNTDIAANPLTGHQTLQAFLLTHFYDIGGLNAGELTSQKWNQLVDYVKSENKRVVALFVRDTWGNSDPKGFYGSVPHSALLEMVNGKLKLRNSVSVSENILIKLRELNGDNVLWYPKGDKELTAEEFDIFRNMKSAVALEQELSAFPELFNNLPDLSHRKKPWTAVRFYVAKISEGSDPCFDYGGNAEILKSNRCDVKIHFDGHYKQVDQNNVTTEFDREDDWGHFETIGSFSGNTFIGNWNETLGSSNYRGTVVITLDNNYTTVTGIDWTEDYTSYWQNNIDATRTSSFSGNNIPKSQIYPGVFQFEGEQTCNHISLLQSIYQNKTTLINQTLESHTCNQFSYITIHLYEKQ